MSQAEKAERTLHITTLPLWMKQQLKQRALRNCRSMAGEVVAILSEAVVEPTEDPRQAKMPI